MDNTDRIIIGVTVGITLSLFNLILKKYVEPIIPEKKKAISYIRKFLFFNLKYTLNIGFMVYFFITLEFNKYFILVMLFYFGILIKSIIEDSISNYRDKILAVHWKQIHSIAEEVDKINGIENN